MYKNESEKYCKLKLMNRLYAVICFSQSHLSSSHLRF